MNRVAWLMGMCGLVACSLGGAVAACGGDDGTTIPPGAQDASAEASSSPPPSNPGSDASVPDDGGTQSTPDGGDAGAGEGGTASTPDKIGCGSAQCEAGSQLCCASLLIDGGASYTCIADNGSCQGAELECDEKADCDDGDVCCTSQGSLGSRCNGSCGGQNVQLCKTNGECPGDAGACKAYTCPGGRTVHACAAPFGCN